MKKTVLFVLNLVFLCFVLGLWHKYSLIKLARASLCDPECKDCQKCEHIADDYWGCVDDNSQTCSGCDNPYSQNYCTSSGNCSGSTCSTTLSCVCEGGECKGKFWCTPYCPGGYEPVTAGGDCIADCEQCGNPQPCRRISGPTPTPGNGNGPTPTPTPNIGLVCDDLSREPITELEIGDEVVFTCIGSSNNVDINHFEFRLSKDAGNSYTVIDNNSVDAVTDPYTIEQAGEYIVQCRVCSSTDDSHCTYWGQAGGWSP